MEYFLHVAIIVLIYGMLALSLNVASGLTELVSLAQAAFFGVGAYTTAILALRYALPFWINLPIAVICTACVALLVGSLVLRTVDEYFVICTLALGAVLFSIMNNWMNLTHGPLGLFGIPPASILGHQIVFKWQWLVLCVLVYGLLLGLAQSIKQSPLGRLLVAIGEDEILCLSYGKNVGIAKLEAFVIGAGMAAIPGVLYAHYISFIDPTSFSIQESIFILAIVIVGKMGNFYGSLISTAFIISIGEILRFIGLPSALAANLRQMLYGVALIFVLWVQQSRVYRQSNNTTTAKKPHLVAP
jgi:branched-chain amino acid transport system permease protein